MTTPTAVISRRVEQARVSITYWMRGEPDARDDDLIEPLRARVRDPLWMLTRQWQLGEFQGADSGSPAYVELSERTGSLEQWQAQGSPATAIAAGPLETQAQKEPFTPDLATSLELGQTFEMLLGDHGAAGLISTFRNDYPVSDLVTDPSDVAEVRLRRVCGGRAIDGVALYLAARAAAPALPPKPAIAPGQQAAVQAAISDLISWVARTVGDLGIQDPVAWQPSRLEYRFDISGTAPDGSAISLSASPGADGMLDWSAFDLQPAQANDRRVRVPKTRTVMPTHIRFRGAPNARFWDFETASTDIGGIVPDKRDLARLAIMDFVLVHANDWFVIPIDLAPGTLHQVDFLLVHDVFGTLTSVGKAEREPVSAGRWSIFATSVVSDEQSVADFFLFPPTAATAIQIAGPIEEVQFARDEMANMVWGLERITENRLGEPWSGHERDMARNASHLNLAGPPPGLRYQIESRVPEYWIPFLPVSVDPTRGLVALERSAMLKGDGTTVEPVGRILKPTSLAAGAPYQIPEEEVPRTGVRVQRVNCRCRWNDGTTYLWQMRRSAPGRGEASSALSFDMALPGGQ